MVDLDPPPLTCQSPSGDFHPQVGWLGSRSCSGIKSCDRLAHTCQFSVVMMHRACEVASFDSNVVKADDFNEMWTETICCPRLKISHRARPFSQKYLLCIPRMTFTWTVRAFELAAFAQSKQRFFSDDVSARHHHRRILIRGLLLRNRANKYGMELV